MTTQLLDTEIRYSRETRDYDILIANVICASAPTYSAAEAIRTQLLTDRRDEGHYTAASELDDEPAESDDDPEAVNWSSRAAIPEGTDPDDFSDVGDDARCSTCRNDGRLCYDCGALDTPAIGRKIKHLMHHDRESLFRILRGTQWRFWPLLARAYVAELGPTEHGVTVPAAGVVGLWGMLLHEADACSESYAGMQKAHS